MRLILPVAGQSSRYPGLRPKWLLTHPNGNLMIAEAIKGISPEYFEEIIIVCLEDHFNKYKIGNVLEKQFNKLAFHNVSIEVIKSSESQPHTVYQAIVNRKIKGSILIKDSDNYFHYNPIQGNCICYASLEEFKRVDASSKSYVQLDEKGIVNNIVEKRVISNVFCVGGYGFLKADDFIVHYEKISNIPNLYISHVIQSMLISGHIFQGNPVKDFLDWGTLHDWNLYRNRYSTLFIDLDGTIVENSAEFFEPYWALSNPIPENVQVINRLYNSGYAQVIVTTSRSEEYSEKTLKQLDKIGLKYHKVIFGILHAKRIVINDYSKSNPYRTCEAINLRRNSTELTDMLNYLINTENIE